MQIALILLVLFTLFPQPAYTQSFEEKPIVPVFYVKGERVVRVDCWGFKQDQKMESLFLKSTDHPDIFTLSHGKNLITVSLLKSEDTLVLETQDTDLGDFNVTTYGLSVGYNLRNQAVDCQIFTGELEDN